MNLFFRLTNYLRHFFLAGNEHSIHSPFVFSLYNSAIRSKKKFYIFDQIELIRTQALLSSEVIQVKDYGAGSVKLSGHSRSVAEITSVSVKKKEEAQLIFRLIHYLKPETIIELGTATGITTCYLAACNSKSRVYTFEGCPETARLARNNFSKLNLNNIELIPGNITDTLLPALKRIQKLDMVFIDANHQYKSTLHYFDTIKNYTHENTCLIFDDIYWSAEMTKAWKEIIADKKVTLSIDLYHFGIVFFRTNAPKQHFRLRV